MHVMVQFWVTVFVIKHCVNDSEDLDNEQEHCHYEHFPPQLASVSGILVLEDRCPWIA